MQLDADYDDSSRGVFVINVMISSLNDHYDIVEAKLMILIFHNDVMRHFMYLVTGCRPATVAAG